VDEVEGRKSEVCEDSTMGTSFVFLVDSIPPSPSYTVDISIQVTFLHKPNMSRNSVWESNW
jgi:hypothetical protein